MLTCKEVSKLISDSLERKLPLRQRISVHLHLMMCNMCRSYRRQILALRQLISRYADTDTTGYEGLRLPDDVRKRIKQKLEEQRKKTVHHRNAYQ